MNPSPESIVEEEMNKWGEYLDEVPPEQTAAFLVGILAHRCYQEESMNLHLKQQIARLEKDLYSKKVPNASN